VGRKTGYPGAARETTLAGMLRRAGLVAVVLMLLSTGSVSAATATVTITRTAFTPNTQAVTLGNAVQW